MTRILIIGGYGVFGHRLVRILNNDPAFDLLIAGRDLRAAQACCESLPMPTRATPCRLDIKDVATKIPQLQPDLIVHAAGPFQGQDYQVARAAISAEIPYVDLSDGRVFSEGFSILDKKARDAGVFALTGVSTTTALSSAAAVRLARQFKQVSTVEIGVTPGNRAPRGKAVIATILSYVGEPIAQLRDGDIVPVTGWGMLSKVKLKGLSPRWFSPVDTADQMSIKNILPEVQTIKFSAGLELGVLHLPLYALAMMRKRKLLPNLQGFTSVFYLVAKLLEPFGSGDGGMFVEVDGRAHDGSAQRVRWTLTATEGDGPNIPAMAAAAVARKFNRKGMIAPGARMCAGEVTLEDFEKEFSAFSIQTHIEVRHDATLL